MRERESESDESEWENTEPSNEVTLRERGVSEKGIKWWSVRVACNNSAIMIVKNCIARGSFRRKLFYTYNFKKITWPTRIITR